MHIAQICLLLFVARIHTILSQPPKKRYLNVWAVKIDGDINRARQIAQLHGYDVVEQIESLPNIFVMKQRSLNTRLKRHAINSTNELIEDPSVLWAEQQLVNVRVKRDFIIPDLLQRHQKEEKNEQLNEWKFGKFMRNLFDQTRHLVFAFEIGKTSFDFNDELWKNQWYIRNTDPMTWNHGIRETWNMGYTGKGVVLSILDDGLEWRHSDIRANYDHMASFDVNDNDDDPSPRYDIHNSNAHGTRCAGEIAMAPNNRKCGVGIAYNSKIGGIRCLDGELSDLSEARALSFRNDYIDIYSSSWGPSDDGSTVDGPKMLAAEALERGVLFGRKGRGSIFVWASGNGGSKGDNCNCDGYVSSIYTISIGSVSESGQFPWYGERCASTMAVAYSSGAFQDRKIATTDIHDGCTTEHSGTSAAAPIAAGILALALEANPKLTWRDMQHILVCTCEFMPLADNKGWKRNGAGFLFNSQFGFGLLMAQSIVKAALLWETVPAKSICVIKVSNSLPITISNGGLIKVSFANSEFSHCPIRFLEHVQVKISFDTSNRGNARMFVVSPRETLSVLMHPRPRDKSIHGFQNMNLTTVQLWGENPIGNWSFYVQNSKNDGSWGTLQSAELILHGINEAAGCLREMPHRRYLHGELITSIIDKTPEYYDDTPFADSSGVFSNLFGRKFETFEHVF